MAPMVAGVALELMVVGLALVIVRSRSNVFNGLSFGLIVGVVGDVCLLCLLAVDLFLLAVVVSCWLLFLLLAVVCSCWLLRLFLVAGVFLVGCLCCCGLLFSC